MVNFIPLRKVLAESYLTQEDARRIASDAGLNLSQIAFSNSATNTWDSILKEAENSGCMEVLLKAIEEDKPHLGQKLPKLQKRVKIPVLIVAMKQDQAIALSDETVFNNSGSNDKLNNFQQFHIALKHHQLGDFQFYYGDKHEKWKPVYCNKTVEEIVEGLFFECNKQNRGTSESLIELDFVSSDFFCNDRQNRERVNRRLEQGGVIIVDAISLFHPDLNEKLVKSGVSGNKNVAVLIVSPIDATTLPVNECIKKIFLNDFDRAYSRLVDDYDHLCAIDLGDKLSLERWLFHTVPSIAHSTHPNGQPHPGQRGNFRKLMDGEESSGIQDYISR